MSVAKQIFFRAFILGGSTLAFLISIYLMMPADKNSYYKAQQDKDALLEKGTSPRLIIIGGSSTAFGIDSKLIGASVNKQTINYGLHVSLGISNILNSVRPNIHKGDIVLLIPEYEAYSYPPAIWGDPLILADMYSAYPAYLRHLAKDNYSMVPEILLFSLQRRLDRAIYLWYYTPEQIRGVYQRSNFNSTGDMIGHLNIPNPSTDKISQAAYSTAIDNKAIEIIKDFITFAQDKGVMVFLDYPPARETNCILTTYDRLKDFDDQIRQNLDIPVLSSPKERCYPDADFFDSFYHLNAEGRSEHSYDVSRSLLRIMELYGRMTKRVLNIDKAALDRVTIDGQVK